MARRALTEHAPGFAIPSLAPEPHSPTTIAESLGREGVRRAYVDGGIVIQQFLAAKLIDDLTLSVIPVLLGSGIPLFGGPGTEQRLHLEEPRSWPTGLVQLRYRVER